MHKCIHMCRHPYTHTYIHIYIQTYIHTDIHTCIHVYICIPPQKNTTHIAHDEPTIWPSSLSYCKVGWHVHRALPVLCIHGVHCMFASSACAACCAHRENCMMHTVCVYSVNIVVALCICCELLWVFCVCPCKLCVLSMDCTDSGTYNFQQTSIPQTGHP